MKNFFDESYLLDSDLARKIYFDNATALPIIDYHCHINPKEIADDRKYDNPTQIMLGGDHYKWRLMRAVGIDEELITGDADDRQKFIAFSKALQLSAGNPVYHWTHLELKKYFGYEGNLNTATAEEVWDLCCDKLKNGLSVREIIRTSDVEVICTTDDPADDLKWHIKCANDKNLETQVLPTFRPDKAVNINKSGFVDYLCKLEEVSAKPINSIQTLKKILEERLDFFVENGCKVADHGLDTIYFKECSDDEADRILKKALNGETILEIEVEKYVTNMMLFFGKLYSERGIVMQLHYGAMRNVNSNMMNKLGVDTGFDCVGDTGCGKQLAQFIDGLEKKGDLPKTIVYSLNHIDNAMIDTITGSFYEAGIRSKVHHGAAWWFNDNKKGIEEHISTYASLLPIGTFLGMLTDSRCFLSFSRHDFFRRIFCNWLADLINKGEYPNDHELVSELIKDVSYNNCKSFFGF